MSFSRATRKGRKLETKIKPCLRYKGITLSCDSAHADIQLREYIRKPDTIAGLRLFIKLVSKQRERFAFC